MAKKKINWAGLAERLKLNVRRTKKQYRDIIFRLVFGENKKALLELYNALNGTHYANEEDLHIVTLDSAIYIQMKNDLAFILAGTINLYEHQSTINPNMPLRFLIYLAKEYQILIEDESNSIYGKTLLPLPTPQCVVLYNGVEEIPDVQTIRLSTAFENKEVEPSVEVLVKVININYGHNNYLMEACEKLSEYTQFVELVRCFAREGMDTQTAVSTAIDYCIEHGILEDIMRKNRGQVLGAFLDTFDKEKYERTLRREGKEETLTKIIINLLNNGTSDEDILKITECTIEQLNEIKQRENI